MSVNREISFIGVSVKLSGRGFITSVFHKSCDKGLYLHQKSFCDEKYKKNLVPMLCHRAFNLSSNRIGFETEMERCISCLKNLGYSEYYVRMAVANYTKKQRLSRGKAAEKLVEKNDSKRFLVIPYKGENAKFLLRNGISSLCQRVGIIQPKIVFTSTKLLSRLRHPEKKADVINNGGVTYMFSCPIAGCNSRYVGVTRCHLFQRVRQHLTAKGDGVTSSSAIGDHLLQHAVSLDFALHSPCFEVLHKSSSWRNLLFIEAHHIKHQSCDLNRQTDSIILHVF